MASAVTLDMSAPLNNHRLLKRMIFWTLVVVVLLYGCVCAGLFFFQRSLLYFPQPRLVNAPQATMILPGDDADLVVTVRPHQGTKAIIYFGGNGEDVSQNLNEYALEFPDYALYFMHYRGFGGSSGQPTEKDNIQDARALYKKVHQQHRDIALFGRSLGSGIAVHLASEVPISHLILITPYDSILNLAAAQYPLIPVKWLLIDRYQSVRFAGLVTAQTLVIAAEHDLTIPRENTDRLFAQFKNGVASLTVISDAGHNDISSKSTYMKAIHAALD